MLMYVVERKLTHEAKKDMKKVVEWNNQLDQWLIDHGAKFESVKHYLSIVGKDICETWYAYPDIVALDKDGDLLKEYKDDPEVMGLFAMQNFYFERLGSRIVKEI